MTIHRESLGGFTLCNGRAPKEQLTIHDDQVTCEECLNILKGFKHTTTYTETLSRAVINKKKLPR